MGEGTEEEEEVGGVRASAGVKGMEEGGGCAGFGAGDGGRAA